MKKIKYTLILIILLAANVTAYAQKSISGTVTDEQKMPVPGATVMVTGTTTGTVTDLNGNFRLTLPQGQNEITVSFVGYVTVTVPVGIQTTLSIVLEESVSELEEIVVVGYGTMRKSDLTGSVTSVKIDETEASRTTSFDQLLQGRAAGVQVTANSFAPGAAVGIKIRGYSSFNGGGEPLYVVDGVILNSPTTNDGQMMSGGSSMLDTPTNGLLGINPQDIASMEVLKDASATAIYGNLGANGVVLITTKQGTSERPTVTWTSSIDISTPSKRIPMMSFDEYVQFQRYRREAHITGAATTELRKIFNSTADVNAPDGYAIDYNSMIAGLEPVDWQDYCLYNSVSQRHRLSVSGKNKTDNYLIALGYADNKGIVKETGLEQIDMRINYDKSLGKSVKIGTRVSIAQSKMEMMQGTSNNNTTQTSMLRSMLRYRPFYNFKDHDSLIEDPDAPVDEDVTVSGPPLWFADYYDNTKEYRVTPSIYFEYTPVPWLTYKITTGGDYRYRERSKWRGPLINRTGDRAFAADNHISNLRYNIDNMLMFNKNFGADHRLSGTIGTTFIHGMNNSRIVEGWNGKQTIPRGDNINTSPSTRYAYLDTKSSIMSYLGRAVYSFRDKYILTATYRVDGSSKFSEENRYASFPSLALAWRVTEEKWMGLPEQISSLKLRFGWGRVGNEAVAPYQTLPIYTISASTLYPDHTIGNESESAVGAAPSFYNRSLKWETSEQINAGIDLALFNHRFSLSVDLYDKTTKDLLQEIATPFSMGTDKMWINKGEIQNRGIEFVIDALIISTKNFSWNLGANASINRNKILTTGVPGGYFLSDKNLGSGNYLSTPGNIFMDGQPMGMFWGIKTNGLVPQGQNGPGATPASDIPEGGINYELLPANATATDAFPLGWLTKDDRQFIGNPNPDLVYGFNTSFAYKNWSLSLNFNGVQGIDVINVNRLMEEDEARSIGNVRRDVFYKMWRPEYQSGFYPKLGVVSNGENEMLFTDRIVEDASFLRLSNVTLNYSIPLKNRKYVRSIDINASVLNAFVITNYKGWDPEVSSFGTELSRMGVDNGSSPHARTYSFGISINF